jgi:hypothetical protein
MAPADLVDIDTRLEAPPVIGLADEEAPAKSDEEHAEGDPH